MREIKFRAWRGEDGGCMEYGHYVADSGSINWFNLSDAVGKKLILMQYTGFRDRDGKEIYEGDIQKQHSGHCFVVRFGEWDNNGDQETRAEGIGFYLESKNGDIEGFAEASLSLVIGNIYENPELLKG